MHRFDEVDARWFGLVGAVAFIVLVLFGAKSCAKKEPVDTRCRDYVVKVSIFSPDAACKPGMTMSVENKRFSSTLVTCKCPAEPATVKP